MSRQLADFNPRFPDERDELKAEMHNRERRAYAAYWRASNSTHPPTEATHFECEGLEYVELSAPVVGQLAVFRVRNDGQLKRLRRVHNFEGARVYSK